MGVWAKVPFRGSRNKGSRASKGNIGLTRNADAGERRRAGKKLQKKRGPGKRAGEVKNPGGVGRTVLEKEI